MIRPSQPCADCTRPMVPMGRPTSPEGHVGHAGRGYCRTCYPKNFRARPKGTQQWVGGPSKGEPDEIAVERAITGERVKLSPVDRAEAVRRLTAEGRSALFIAEQLGITTRTVTRIRSKVAA